MLKLIVISAPSGTGKTSLIDALIEESKEFNLKLAISFTTREKRKNERNGKSYFFIDRKEFKEMLDRNEFLESAEVFGNLYGTSKSWVDKQLQSGFNIILELDWQGAFKIKQTFPSALTIFLLPPSYEELEQRLIKRNRDIKKVIKERLAMAKKEIIKGKDFDLLIANDSFEMALKDIKMALKEDAYITEKRQSLAQSYLQVLLNN